MLFRRKISIIRKALTDLNLNDKCQINIFNNGVIVSQVFRARNFAFKYKFPHTYDIAILSRKIPPSDL
jgi:hypothetical protein